jgi:peptidylprolyl isomerase/peptidyl-prolyl cis-trans isomerase B (cyclophilin B)
VTGILRRAAAPILSLTLVACGSPPAASQAPTGCPTSAPTAAEANTINADAERAEVATNLGSFTIELDAGSAPVAAANFVLLARCGFYAGVSFHRVIAGFVAQAGDPQTRSNRGPFEGLGGGGPGYHFEVELPDESQPYDPYVVAMANAMDYDFATGEIRGGTDTNGSQFFIDLASLVGQLRPYYSVIGKVVDGTDVVDAIGAVAVNNPQDGVPLEPVIIASITIESGG